MDATATGGRSDRFDPTLTFARDDPPRAPRIDLNRATLEQLLPLPGVDRVRAGRILEARRKRRFAHVDELLSRGVLPPSVFRRVRGRVRADFMEEPYLAGIAPSGGKMRRGQPSVLQLRFEDSEAGVRLANVQAHSVSHSLDLSREVTREERRRGVIAFELPGMAQGVVNVEAALYDGAGARDRLTSSLTVLPNPGELTITAFPAGGSLRTVNGAARPTSDGGYLCSAAFTFANGSGVERRLRGRVEWVAFRGLWNRVEGSFDWGREIVVPAGGSSTGWYLDVRLSRGSGIAQALRDGHGITIRYRFRETSGAAHDVALTWRTVRGPHVNVIYVGTELFSAEDRRTVLESLVVTDAIYAQRDLGIGRVREWFISLVEAGHYVTINDDGEARDLTNRWTAPADGIDLFIVNLYEGTRAGYSAIDGPCEKNEDWWKIKDMTGSVVELYTPNRASLGALIGHELGHYLGLEHAKLLWTPNAMMNLMWPVISAGRTQLTAGQGDDMRDHCFTRNLG